MLKRIKKTPAQLLATEMARSFEDIIAKRLDDPECKRFYVALMLALPTLERYDMTSMEQTLQRHIGIQQIAKTLEVV
jgi:hypothetical protein